MTTGVDTLRLAAPVAAGTLDDVVAALWAEADGTGTTGLVGAAGAAVARTLGLPPLVAPPGQAAPPWDGDTAAVLGFAEQCCVDVASVTPAQRSAFLDATGPLAGSLAAALWVVDLVPRARGALDALFGPGPWPPPVARAAPGGLWGALDGLVRTVPALDALDPVTSELVRLRGARAHDCRLCRSLRSRAALRAGATEADFDAVDHHAGSDLPPLARAALAFCDAMVWTPGHIPDGVVAELTYLATPAQRVELVLDVTRNALNKVAVALGADAAHVEDGVEIYDVAPDGSLLYGLTPD